MSEVARITRTEATFISLLIFAAGSAAPFVFDKLKTLLQPGGKFSSINKPTAGPRTEKELPVGQHPLQLYSLATPNGQKVTCLLEELGLKYDAWRIDIMNGDQFTSGFVAVNPNSKIPAMVDKQGPSGGQPVNLFESASIMLYLAEKTGKLIPSDPVLRADTLNWLFFQVGSAPYFGQFGHFTRYAPVKIKYAVDRYATETMRILDVLNRHLKGRTFLVGEQLTIADLAWMPWVNGLSVFYKADDALQLESYKEVNRWKEALLARPAVAKGLKINSADPEYKEYHS